jgi:hypothetical protein
MYRRELEMRAYQTLSTTENFRSEHKTIKMLTACRAQETYDSVILQTLGLSRVLISYPQNFRPVIAIMRCRYECCGPAPGPRVRTRRKN